VYIVKRGKNNFAEFFLKKGQRNHIISTKKDRGKKGKMALTSKTKKKMYKKVIYYYFTI